MSRRGWALPAATRIQSKHSESPPDALREDETQVLCVGILQVVMGAGGAVPAWGALSCLPLTFPEEPCLSLALAA